MRILADDPPGMTNVTILADDVGTLPAISVSDIAGKVFSMRSTAKLGKALTFARANHDLLTTASLRAEGLSRSQIGRLVDDRVIERVIRGLYRLAGSRTRLQDIAACLLRHPRADASHVSALFVHDLDIDPPRRPHFTLPEHSGAATPLGVGHRSPLLPVDRTVRKGLRVTTLARAIVDSSEVLSVERLAEVVNEAVSRKLVAIPAIVEAAARAESAPGRAGLGSLRTVLASWTDAIEPDSVTEAAAIRRITSFGLSAPVTQHEVYDGDTFVARLDMAWPGAMVGREYVSARWHRPDRVEADELRLQALEDLGWSVDNLYRYQLQANEVDWLRDLAAQLAGGNAATG